MLLFHYRMDSDTKHSSFQVSKIINGQHTVLINKNDLSLLNNCINEALQALDEDEFKIRTGYSQESAETLLQDIHSALGKNPDSENSPTSST
jgi:hypothetical protein